MPKTKSAPKKKKLSGTERNRRLLARERKEVSHLSVVVDDQLRQQLEAYARKSEGLTAKSTKRPNLSFAVCNLLRSALGLPTVIAA